MQECQEVEDKAALANDVESTPFDPQLVYAVVTVSICFDQAFGLSQRK